MKAIVLSFDRQHPYVELSYRMYMDLWPECPFTFRVPWNNIKPKSLMGYPNIELIQCDKDIRLTMQALLEDIEDNEWVYWCIDDRFPISINVSEMSKLYNNLHQYEEFYYVRPFSYKYFNKNNTPNTILSKSPQFSIQSNTHEYGYYMHHFCKAHILKTLFSLEDCISIYDFHHHLTRKFYQNITGLRLLSNKKDWIEFREQSANGKITGICKKYLDQLNIKY
jgi:hypothetical protein